MSYRLIEEVSNSRSSAVYAAFVPNSPMVQNRCIRSSNVGLLTAVKKILLGIGSSCGILFVDTDPATIHSNSVFRKTGPDDTGRICSSRMISKKWAALISIFTLCDILNHGSANCMSFGIWYFSDIVFRVVKWPVIFGITTIWSVTLYSFTRHFICTDTDDDVCCILLPIPLITCFIFFLSNAMFVLIFRDKISLWTLLDVVLVFPMPICDPVNCPKTFVNFPMSFR